MIAKTQMVPYPKLTGKNKINRITKVLRKYLDVKRGHNCSYKTQRTYSPDSISYITLTLVSHLVFYKSTNLLYLRDHSNTDMRFEH